MRQRASLDSFPASMAGPPNRRLVRCRSTRLAFVCTIVITGISSAQLTAADQSGPSETIHSEFHPDQSNLPVPPPPGAIVLLGVDADPGGFTSMSGGRVDWKSVEGTLEVATTPGHANHVVSRQVFRDADLHAEFMIHPRAHGNSGIYIHGHYEMQIYDSFAAAQSGVPPTEQDAGSLYRFAAPLVHAVRKPGEWQVYDIRYVAPRRDEKGLIVRPGSITAWLNGSKVQDDVGFTEPRSPYTPFRHGVTDHLRTVERRLIETGEGPLFLQDHGSPTRCRNIWILPLQAPRTGERTPPNQPPLRSP
ncbi:MAG: DUF1080 domain-containing protein [Planctomycetaceae bacterium]